MKVDLSFFLRSLVLSATLCDTDFTMCRGYLLVRDNFFHPDLGPVSNLGEGVEGWRGYHSSVRPTGLGLTLNLGRCIQHFLK